MAQITIEPPASEWCERARQNVLRREQMSVSADALREFRLQVLSRAGEFTAQNFCGMKNQPSDQKKIIAAGHQPVIYHPGVLRKNLMLTESVVANGTHGLNVIIDTDTGDAGSFSYPVRLAADEYTVMTANLSTGGEIYLSQKIKSSVDLRSVFDMVRGQILPELVSQLNQIEQQYSESAGRCAILANARIRRAFEGQPAYDEILLTDLISLPFARDFYARLIQSGKAFVENFNSQLDQFRIERKIKNHANPFPNLNISAGQFELPFWAIEREKGIRGALMLRESDQTLLYNGLPLCQVNDAADWFDWNQKDKPIRFSPRALTITALLRLFVSDFFLHGLGGARYDVFLDRIFSSWFGIEAPAFGIVSQTKSLFPEKVLELDRDTALLAKTREIQFHLDQYLDNGTFTEERSAALRLLWISRQELVEQLKQVKMAGGSAADVTQKLKAVDLSIKNSLQDFFSSIHVPSEGTQRAYRYREFPYFLFSREKL